MKIPNKTDDLRTRIVRSIRSDPWTGHIRKRPKYAIDKSGWPTGNGK